MAGIGFYYYQRYKDDGSTSWASAASYEFLIFNMLMYMAWYDAFFGAKLIELGWKAGYTHPFLGF